MSSELARIDTGRAIIMADALSQESEQRKLLGEYIHRHMTEGTDYGVIPGTKNKTLLKPGAEKLTQLFRCIPRYTIVNKVEDWESGLFSYQFQCQIVTQATETVVAEGVGSCSTYESRYRWRQSERVCPACGKPAIIKGKAEYGGGWICFKKKDGCGAKFGDNDPDITGQQTGRVQNPDIHDQVNTVLKMAKKRALVDAAISLARCSDIFTQDVEDFSHHEEAPRHTDYPTQHQPVPQQQHQPSRDPVKDWDERIAFTENLEDFNGLLSWPEIKQLTPPQRKQVWNLFMLHAERMGWMFDDSLKSFVVAPSS